MKLGVSLIRAYLSHFTSHSIAHPDPYVKGYDLTEVDCEFVHLRRKIPV